VAFSSYSVPTFGGAVLSLFLKAAVSDISLVTDSKCLARFSFMTGKSSPLNPRTPPPIFQISPASSIPWHRQIHLQTRIGRSNVSVKKIFHHIFSAA
jgi:hypothetical protein